MKPGDTKKLVESYAIDMARTQLELLMQQCTASQLRKFRIIYPKLTKDNIYSAIELVERTVIKNERKNGGN